VATPRYLGAIEDFRRARRRAGLEQLLAALRGRPSALLSFDRLQRELGMSSRTNRGLQEIPLEAIVGSVGRYADFTRSFLPLSDEMEERWARVKAAATGLSGWPPIEVYRLGDVYFVLDGNHRVSVARQMGLKTIPAYVTEIKTRVPLTADDDPDEVIIQARRAEFLQRTKLEQSRPGSDLRVTAPGAYRVLDEHIQVHRYYMGQNEQREVSYEEAAAHWYDVVYQPVANLIRERGLLQEFPDRTETDLYLWLAEHRAELEEALGWEVQPSDAAEDLVTGQSRRPRHVLARVGERLRDAVSPDELEPGPPPGAWRTGRVAGRADDRLFVDIMVAINGQETGWRALDQAAQVARLEQTGVRGLHVVPDAADATGEAVEAVREHFYRQLEDAGVGGVLIVETGSVPSAICDRGRWNDLIVMPLSYPPSRQPLQQLGSGLRQVISRCARPILAVPVYAPMHRALLAYHGGRQAQEALFIATYLAGRWQTELVVLVVTEGDGRPDAGALAAARSYLAERGVQAEFESGAGPVAENILATAGTAGADFIVMGSYGQRPVVQLLTGSVLSDVLRETEKPVLIAR
jgi:nucleotide-binding universal stress UspA family protein